MPLSRKERKILIDVLVDNDIAMPEIPEDFLRKGFKGYNNYTDRALIREANSRGEDYKDLISQAMLRKSNSSSWHFLWLCYNGYMMKNIDINALGNKALGYVIAFGYGFIVAMMIFERV